MTPPGLARRPGISTRLAPLAAAVMLALAPAAQAVTAVSITRPSAWVSEEDFMGSTVYSVHFAIPYAAWNCGYADDNTYYSKMYRNGAWASSGGTTNIYYTYVNNLNGSLDDEIYVEFGKSGGSHGITVCAQTNTFTFAKILWPSISSSVPADNATGVLPGSAIALTFSDAMTVGSGSFKIVNDTDATTETIDVAADGGKFAWSSGNTVLTVTPGSPLVVGKAYHVEIGAAAFKDGSNAYFPGISNSTSLNFAMAGGPKFSGVYPAAAGSIGPSVNTRIRYTLDKDAVSGTITYARSGGTADSSSPHTCTLQGTALQAGGRAVARWADANGCTSAVSLVDGAVYDITLSASDGSYSTTTTIAGVSYDSSPATGASIAAVDNDNSGTFNAGDTLIVQFSEPIDSNSLNDASYFILNYMGSGASLAPLNASQDGYASSFALTLGTSANVQIGATLGIYSSYISRVRDRADNAPSDAILFTIPAFNARPTAGSVAVSGSATVGQTLTGSYVYADAEADSEGVTTRQWKSGSLANGSDKAAITGATSASYVLQAGEGGKYVFYCVTPSAVSGALSGVEACSAASAQVAAIAPAQAVVTLTGSDTQATLTFPTPSNGGAALSGYSVVVTPSGGSPVTLAIPDVAANSNVTAGGLTATVTSVGGGNTLITVTGLSAGTAYAFTVAAANSVGSGSASNAAPAASAVAIAGTVAVGQTLTGSHGYFDLESDAQGATTRQWKSGSAADGSDKAAIAGATSATYTLQIGEAGKYVFYCVTPVAASGASPGIETCSAASAQVPAVAPAQPVVALLDGGDQVILTFPTPSDGGAALSGYSVVVTPVGGAPVTLAIPYISAQANATASGLTAVLTSFAGGNTEIVVLGFATGTAYAYAFTVAAVNSAGSGSASNARPTASTVAIAGTATVGQTLTGSYLYGDLESDAQGATTQQWKSGSAANGSNKAAIAGATSTTYLLQDGDAGKYLFYCVTPLAAAGASPGIEACGAVGAQVAATVPAQPVVTVTPGNTQTTLTFATPATGGAALNGYSVVVTPSGGSPVTLTIPGVAATSTVTASGLTATVTSVGGGNTVITVTGLANGTAYAFTAGAANAGGAGPVSTAQQATPATLPGTPLVTASGAHQKALLSFATPADGGSPLTGYDVVVTPNGGASVTLSVPGASIAASVTTSGLTAAVTAVVGGTTVLTVTGLSDGTAYGISVKAKNATGNGTASTPVSVTPAPSIPDTVTVAASAGNALATLAFPAPANNGAALDKYAVYLTPYVNSVPASVVFLSLNGVTAGTSAASAPYGAEITGVAQDGSVTVSVSGLSNGLQYGLIVRAHNSAGWSSDSVERKITPAAPTAAPGGGDSTPPTAPANPTLPSGGGTLAPTNGQIVTVTDNSTSGSTINLPPPPTSSGVNPATITVNLPGTGNLTVSSSGGNAQVAVQQVTLGGKTTPTLTVTQGSATTTATASGQALIATKDAGIVVSANNTGTSASMTVTNGNANLGVSGGSTITVQSGGNRVVTVEVGGQTLQVQVGSASAQVSFTKVDIGGVSTPVLTVTGGGVLNVTAQNNGAPLLAVGNGGTLVQAAGGSNCQSVVNTQSDSQHTNVHVATCSVVLPANAFAGQGFAAVKDNTVLVGETVEFDAAGKVTKVRLGTLAGDTAIAGDKLGRTNSASLEYRAWIPQLDAIPTRFSPAAKLGDAIVAQVKKDLPEFSYQGMQADGSLRFATADGRLISALPVDTVEVDTSQPDGITVDTHNKVKVTTQGLITRFSANATDLPALAAGIQTACPTCKTMQIEDGNLHVTNGSVVYAGVADWYVYDKPGASGFNNIPYGPVSYTDTGRNQPIYPTAGDLEAILAAVQAIDPKATTQVQGDGSVLIQVNGNKYTLMPDYAMQTQAPAAHANDAWWQGTDGRIYLKNRNGSVQGYLVK